MIVEAERSQSCSRPLEAQESLWCGSSPNPKAQQPRDQWCETQAETEGLRTKNTDVWGQEKMNISAPAKSQFLLFALLSSSGP